MKFFYMALVLFVFQASIGIMQSTGHFGDAAFTSDNSWQVNVADIRDKNVTTLTTADDSNVITDLLNFFTPKVARDFVSVMANAVFVPYTILTFLGIESSIAVIVELIVSLIYVAGLWDLLRGGMIE